MTGKWSRPTWAGGETTRAGRVPRFLAGGLFQITTRAAPGQ